LQMSIVLEGPRGTRVVEGEARELPEIGHFRVTVREVCTGRFASTLEHATLNPLFEG
jgi:hypothetical protein